MAAGISIHSHLCVARTHLTLLPLGLSFVLIAFEDLLCILILHTPLESEVSDTKLQHLNSNRRPLVELSHDLSQHDGTGRPLLPHGILIHDRQMYTVQRHGL